MVHSPGCFLSPTTAFTVFFSNDEVFGECTRCENNNKINRAVRKWLIVGRGLHFFKRRVKSKKFRYITAFYVYCFRREIKSTEGNICSKWSADRNLPPGRKPKTVAIRTTTTEKITMYVWFVLKDIGCCEIDSAETTVTIHFQLGVKVVLIMNIDTIT